MFLYSVFHIQLHRAALFPPSFPTRRSSDLGGLYLVADPSMDKKELLYKLDEALFAGVQVVQIWNHWPSSFDRVQKEKLISEVMALARPYGSPVLINEEWELLKTTDLV